MQSLFQFNSAAIDGLSVSDIAERVYSSLSQIEDEVRNALEEQVQGEHFEVTWEDGNIVVLLDDEQSEREYGSSTVAMRPVVRTALTKATEALRTKLVTGV